MLCVVLMVCALPVRAQEEVELQPMFYHNPVKTVSIQESNTASGQPALRVVFKSRVTRAFINDNLYLETPDAPGRAIPFVAHDGRLKSAVALWNNSHTSDDAVAPNEAAMLDRLAGTVWRLEPIKPLPPGQVYRLKVRNTAPPANPSAEQTDRVSNVTLYQFKTTEKESRTYLRQMFNPQTWTACGTDC